MNTIDFLKNKWTGWVIKFLLYAGIIDLFYIYGSALVYRVEDLINNTAQPLLSIKICFDTVIILSLVIFVYFRFVKKEKEIWWIIAPLALMIIYEIFLGTRAVLYNGLTNNLRLSYTLDIARVIGVFLIYLLDIACTNIRKKK